MGRPSSSVGPTRMRAGRRRLTPGMHSAPAARPHGAGRASIGFSSSTSERRRGDGLMVETGEGFTCEPTPAAGCLHPVSTRRCRACPDARKASPPQGARLPAGTRPGRRTIGEHLLRLTAGPRRIGAPGSSMIVGARRLHLSLNRWFSRSVHSDEARLPATGIDDQRELGRQTATRPILDQPGLVRESQPYTPATSLLLGVKPGRAT
jgi:hypothetical protein